MSFERLLFASNLLVWVTGCGTAASPTQTAGGPPELSTTPDPPSTPWTECYSTFDADHQSPKDDLRKLTRMCGTVGGMRAITPVATGRQGQKDPVDRYTFHVPRAGACYRVFGVGDRTIQDLDLLLRGPDGEGAVGDVTHDAFPVLPPNGPVCFDAPGLYMLEVSVYRGEGSYAVQVWGNVAPGGQKPQAR